MLYVRICCLVRIIHPDGCRSGVRQGFSKASIDNYEQHLSFVDKTQKGKLSCCGTLQPSTHCLAVFLPYQLSTVG